MGDVKEIFRWASIGPREVVSVSVGTYGHDEFVAFSINIKLASNQPSGAYTTIAAQLSEGPTTLQGGGIRRTLLVENQTVGPQPFVSVGLMRFRQRVPTTISIGDLIDDRIKRVSARPTKAQLSTAFVWHGADGTIQAVGSHPGELEEENIEPVSKTGQKLLVFPLSDEALRTVHLTHRVDRDRLLCVSELPKQ